MYTPGWTPLHLASKTGHTDIVDTLLAAQQEQHRIKRNAGNCAGELGAKVNAECANILKKGIATDLPARQTDWRGRTYRRISTEGHLRQTPRDLGAKGPSPVAPSRSANASDQQTTTTAQWPQGSIIADADETANKDDAATLRLTYNNSNQCTIDVLIWKSTNIGTGLPSASALPPLPHVKTAEELSTMIWEEYIAIGKPVLIKGGAAGWGIKKWMPDYLRGSPFESMRFPVSDVPYSNVYGGNAAVESTLGAFVNQTLARSTWLHRDPSSSTSSGDDAPTAPAPSVPYIFFGLDQEQEKVFAPDLVQAHAPPFLGGKFEFRTRTPQFYLGSAGSAAPMHFHEDAFNALAYGEKRWILLPPSRAAFSTVPGTEWLLQQQLKEKNADNYNGDLKYGMFCTQKAGDVIYVPHGWGHAVINNRASVGVAVNFEHPFRTF